MRGNKKTPKKMSDPYNLEFHGHKIDPTRVGKIFEVTDPNLFQSLKKLLRAGRKHKTKTQDIKECITSLLRYLEMEQEDLDCKVCQAAREAIGETDEVESQDTIGPALTKEIERCRELLKQYESLGSVGDFGRIMIIKDIEEAVEAMQVWDVPLMIASYKKLQGAK